MATTTIPWGDGSGDNIYLTYSSASGNQTVEVTSDANTGSARSKVVTFSTGSISRQMTVNQEDGESYIVFADPLVEQICATNWGDGVGLKPSQAARVTNAQFGTTFKNNTQITSFEELQYFTGLTELPIEAFYGCSSLESIVIPTSVTTIQTSALRACGFVGTLTIPPSVTSLGSSSLRKLPGLTNLIINTITSPRIIFYYGNDTTGNGLGTIWFNGGVSTTTAQSPGMSFKNIVVDGDVYSNQGGVSYVLGNNSSVKAIWISGNVNVANIIHNSSGSLKFIECMGTVTSSANGAFIRGGQRDVIIHLGYDGIACAPNKIFSSNAVSSTYWRVIYVGDGSSAAHDNAVLAQYTSDTNWSAYSDRLDTWYNYIQSGGEYVTKPTMPSNNS